MRYTLFLLMSLLLLAGCSTQDANLKKHWQPAPYLLKAVPTYRPSENVRGLNLGLFKDTAEFSKKLMSPGGGLSPAEKARTLSNNNTILGFWQICCPLLNPGNLREIAARLGGDYYEYSAIYSGRATGTRMVPVGYTTPQFATTTSQASGYGNYNGSYVNNYGGGGNIYGNAFANAYGSSQTMLSGSTTYAAQHYQYEVATQNITIFATPKRAAELVKLGVLPSNYAPGQTQKR